MCVASDLDLAGEDLHIVSRMLRPRGIVRQPCTAFDPLLREGLGRQRGGWRQALSRGRDQCCQPAEIRLPVDLFDQLGEFVDR